GFIALLAVALTTALLVYDLEKPERFLYILARPQWRSWLTRGAVILISFSTVTGLWWVMEVAGLFGWLAPETIATGRTVLLTPNIVLAGLAAVYTAFLFAQAEGRDLWQSPLLPPHLLIQAGMVGSGFLLGLGAIFTLPNAVILTLAYIFVALLVVDLVVTLGGEFAMPHASELAARAAHEISHGRYRNHFWGGAIILGHALPLMILIGGLSHISLTAVFGLVAAVCAAIGLFFYEYAFVMAPQEIPNS
ncbi:MAG: polysulfide reductase NrfD, partial [Anaerolineales bacterium]|nr:polysulfide reductase NrfD [Anaerolineales bacterium]